MSYFYGNQLRPITSTFISCNEHQCHIALDGNGDYWMVVDTQDYSDGDPLEFIPCELGPEPA